jgi:hypothetical protein
MDTTNYCLECAANATRIAELEAEAALSNRDALEIISAAYLLLLKVPHGSRVRNAAQGTMCRCVDFIAETTGKPREEVQDQAEAEAMADDAGT